MRRRVKELTRFIVAALVIIIIAPQVLAQDGGGRLTIRYFDLDEDQAYEAYSGDMILITTPDGKNILIDSYGPLVADNAVKRLEELGIERLDYAIASHPHVDHIGGFPTIFDNFEVGKFYQINVPYNTSSHYRRLQESLVAHKIEMAFLEEGDTFQLGDVTFTVFNPPKGTNPENVPSPEALTAPKILNQYSLVMLMDYKDFSMLFTGDIYVSREMDLVLEFDELLEADILDVPHHGATTSSSYMFIKTVQPKYAIVNNDSLLPAESFEKYTDLGIDMFVTASHGEITIVTDGENIEITTERELSDYLKQLKWAVSVDPAA